MQLDCYVTNHDLNVVELLNFGIRFFDFDLKYYSEKDDMWTGHGPKDLFFTTARFEEVLEDIQQWMIKHLHELVIVYVGSLVGDDRGLGLEKLTKLLDKHISGEVKLNDYWRIHRDWPTLKTAIDEKKRLFAFGAFGKFCSMYVLYTVPIRKCIGLCQGISAPAKIGAAHRMRTGLIFRCGAPVAHRFDFPVRRTGQRTDPGALAHRLAHRQHKICNFSLSGNRSHFILGAGARNQSLFGTQLLEASLSHPFFTLETNHQ